MHEGFAREISLPSIKFSVGSRDSTNARIIQDIRIERYENGLVEFVLWLKNDDETVDYMFYSHSGDYQIYWGVREYDSQTDTFKGHSMEEAWTVHEN